MNLRTSSKSKALNSESEVQSPKSEAQSLRTVFCTATPSNPFPFFESVSAGFPSPAADYMDKTLDLNELCIKNPSSTFFIRVSGDSMRGAGIFDGDILIVDRSIHARPRDVVVAVLDGDFLVKRLHKQGSTVFLAAENLDYAPILIEESSDFQIWGVVVKVIHTI